MATVVVFRPGTIVARRYSLCVVNAGSTAWLQSRVPDRPEIATTTRRDWLGRPRICSAVIPGDRRAISSGRS
jgi:hypothetical protein